MDKYERRRRNLAQLVKEHCGGIDAEMARRIGRAPSYLARRLYEEGKLGKKRIGDDMTDVIEDAFNLPRGWLSLEQSEGMSLGANSPPNERQEKPPKYLSPDEISELIRLYANSDDAGRASILTVARAQVSETNVAASESAAQNKRKHRG